MKTSQHVSEILRQSVEGVNESLDRMLRERAVGQTAPLYQMLRYFMGFTDEQFTPLSKGKTGKRFRPALCLFLADAYGARAKAYDAALAIELFHNFTLIHDDVEDRDEVRHGRPTVWKVWGVNHAINSGDVQSLIACDLCVRAGAKSGAGERLTRAMLASFAEVVEGQYLDFELASASLESGTVNEETYLSMTRKKTGALMSLCGEVTGIVAGRSNDECARLRKYGMSLGVAFQIADDYRSVWSRREETGKDTHSDIREHKRTFPFLVAYGELQGAAHRRLAELYVPPRQLTEVEIAEALTLLDATAAQTRTRELIRTYASAARAAALSLTLPEETRASLADIIETLVPESRSLS